MGAAGSLIQNMEELLTVCSRSIVAPEKVTSEAGKVITIMNDPNLDRKFLVAGCESLSLIAYGFIRCGYDSFIIAYAGKTGVDHFESGFTDKNELIKFCEFCVEYGGEILIELGNKLQTQLEIENGMTKDEILNLNLYRNTITVQDHMINYIKLSLLLNSLSEFFKKYYKGLN